MYINGGEPHADQEDTFRKIIGSIGYTRGAAGFFSQAYWGINGAALLPWIILGAAVIAGIVVLIVLLRIRRKKHPKQKKDVPQGAPYTPPAPQNQGQPYGQGMPPYTTPQNQGQQYQPVQPQQTSYEPPAAPQPYQPVQPTQPTMGGEPQQQPTQQPQAYEPSPVAQTAASPAGTWAERATAGGRGTRRRCGIARKPCRIEAAGRDQPGGI